MKKTSDNQAVLKVITQFFVRSIPDGWFNGIAADQLLQTGLSAERLKAILKALISTGRINCTFYEYDMNIHIKRMPSLSVSKQLELLASHDLHLVGCYPTEKAIRSSFDLEALNDQPYSKMLASGRSQLEFVGFDFAVLERYYNDPRFSFSFEDYAGHMSIRDEYYKSGENVRDDVSIQTFGLGFDAKEVPVAIAFLRYLANMNSSHQLYWKSYETATSTKMSYQYYKSSIVGDFYENRSLINAVAECIAGINQLTSDIFGKGFFREEMPSQRPLDLGIFLRPTARNFQRFSIALDHVLSENIREDFFPNDVPRTEQKIVKGVAVEQKIGTLRMYERWLFGRFRFGDPDLAKRHLIAPLQEVRKLRQKPAHKTTEDSYDIAYYTKRREVLERVYDGLISFIELLERHPKGVKASLSEAVRRGNLEPW